jgi:tRNA nucleotidyltransferase (CCA-adding enzyme)
MTTFHPSLYDIREKVLNSVRPTLADRAHLQEVSDSIIARVESLAKDRGLNLKAVLVGSAARSTWLAGDHDLDIFLGVQPDGDLEAAMDVARLAAPIHEEKYAEHPYVHARLDGFEVDLVPCYLVENASDLKSAVDRTPFHTKYVARRIAGLEDEVLLVKQFMKGTGVYGSELKVGGFSGYLAELLVIRYCSFPLVLQAALAWRPGEIIDLEGHAARAHDEPLIVVDPVDPRRNVAAALTLDRMLAFAAASRSFLAEPSLDYFFPEALMPLSDEDLKAQIEARGTCLILIEFRSPSVVEDVLYPQLRKAEDSAGALLKRHGFSVLRSSTGAYRDRAVMLFEMEVWELSRVCRRTGPPVWETEHLSRFLAAHSSPLSGPYISGEKVVVEEARRYTLASELLAAEVGHLSLGKHLSRAVQSGCNIFVGLEMARIKDTEFRIFLAGYFQAKIKGLARY